MLCFLGASFFGFGFIFLMDRKLITIGNVLFLSGLTVGAHRAWHKTKPSFKTPRLDTGLFFLADDLRPHTNDHVFQNTLEQGLMFLSRLEHPAPRLKLRVFHPLVVSTPVRHASISLDRTI